MFGLNTYGSMGGQAAANEVAGDYRGRNKVADLEQKSQNRRIQQEQWDIQSKQQVDNLERSRMGTMARKTLATESGAIPAQQIQALETEMKTLTDGMKKREGQDINNLLTRFLGSLQPEDELTGITKVLEAQPQLAAKLQVDPKTMRMFQKGDKRDNEMLRKWLTKTNPQYGKMVPAMQQEIIDDVITSKVVIEANGMPVDMYGMSVATGAANQADAKTTDIINRKLAGQPSQEAENAKLAITTKTPPAEIQTAAYSNEPEAVMEGKPEAPAEGEPTGGANASLKAKIKNIENPTNVSSKNKNGYEGPYQFRYRDKTDAGYDIAKELGYTAEEIRQDPNKQEEVMDTYLARNKKALENKGIEPTDYNMWLAHNQGAGGANAILKGKLTPTIRKNIKNQGIEGSTDAELIANYHDKFQSKMGDETTIEPGPDAQTSGWENKPYNSTGSSADRERNKVLNNLAGFGNQDDRTALMKNLDYVAEQLGGDATMGEVESTYRTLMGDDGGSSNAKYPTFEYAKEHILGNTVKEFGPDWQSSPQAVQQYARKMREAEARFIGPGAGGVQKMQDERAIASGMGKWDTFKQGDYKDTGIDYAAKATQGRLLDGDTENKKQYTEGIQKQKVNQATNHLYNKLQKLDKNGEFNYGILGTLQQTLASYAPGEMLSEERTAKMMKGAGIRSEYQKVMSEWLRALSGTAASANEVGRVMGQVGSNEWKNSKDALARLNSFNQSTARDMRNTAEVLGGAGYSEAAKELYNNSNANVRANNPDSKTTERVQQGVGSKPAPAPNDNPASDQVIQAMPSFDISTLPKNTQAFLNDMPVGKSVEVEGIEYTKTPNGFKQEIGGL